MEEINLFLSDISDGEYDGKPMLFDELQTLENPALREKLGLRPNQTGMMVNKPAMYSGKSYLDKWDVITHIGEHSIDNEGKVIVQNLRLNFAYMVQHLEKEKNIGITILRKGKEAEVTIPLISERSHLIPFLKDGYPRYFIYGPLVFSAAASEFIRFMNNQMQAGLLQRSSPLMTRFMDNTKFDGEELVVVSSSMFSHTITRGYDNPYTFVIDEVNGKKVKNLKSLVEQIRDMKEPFIEINFADNFTETMVFRKSEMEAVTEEVLTENGIRFQYSDDIKDVWEKR